MEKTNVEQFNELVVVFNENYQKFHLKGTASAGTRARKDLAALTKVAKLIRGEIQDLKKAAKAAA